MKYKFELEDYFLFAVIFLLVALSLGLMAFGVSVVSERRVIEQPSICYGVEKDGSRSTYCAETVDMEKAYKSGGLVKDN